MYVAAVFDAVQSALDRWDDASLRMKASLASGGGDTTASQYLDELANVYVRVVDVVSATPPEGPSEHDALAYSLASSVTSMLQEDLIAKQAMVVHWATAPAATRGTYLHTNGAPYALHPTALQTVVERLAGLKALGMKQY